MKTLRLVVKPPHGEVRVSVPLRLKDDAVCAFVASHIPWIEAQQAEFAARDLPAAPNYEEGAIHKVWGQDKALKLCAGRSSVCVEGDTLRISLPGGGDSEARQRSLENFYRDEINRVAPALFDHYQSAMGLYCREWRIKKMRTRWGSCNIQAKRVWLNLALASFPKDCLAYVIVHELAHLEERYHDAKFWHLVEQHCPQWREIRAKLNG